MFKCLKSVTSRNLPHFFGTQEIGETHLGFNGAISIHPSNNKLEISVSKNVSSDLVKTLLLISKLSTSRVKGNLIPLLIQLRTVSQDPILSKHLNVSVNYFS